MTLRALFLISTAVTAASSTSDHEVTLTEADIMDFMESDEVEALNLMQSQSSLTASPRTILRNAATAAQTPPVAADDGVFDSLAFSQTALEVSSAEPVVGTEARPVWLAGRGEDVAEHDEDAKCSAEGLTPGVCAITALARPVVAATSADNATERAAADAERLERALFKEIEAALAGTHGGISTARLAELKEGLRGFFESLPKSKAGRLDHPTVRYALHQHFVRGHAWYVRSLNPVGEAQAPASPGEALRGQVPLHLQTLIEKRQEGRGLDLHELAALVATLEHLIHGDVGERLKAAYRAHLLEPSSPTPPLDVMEAVKTYMAHFLSLTHRSGHAVTPEEARQERQSIERGYSGWQSISDMITEAVMARAPNGTGSALAFSKALSATEEVLKTFEAVSASDCQTIKRGLTEMPNGASGAVLLADLHKRALEGQTLLSESSEYLAALGALSEGENGVSVLVPNYVYSPSNCLGTTSFFDMCCPSECETLMDQLETRLRKPEVEPSEALATLRSFRSDNAISKEALAELDALALQRSGRIPLHGYGFALWIHHAFPRECPRPRAEDYKGARQGAEVPAAEGEFQEVAKLPKVAASRSELAEEVMMVSEQEQEGAAPAANGTKASAGAVLTTEMLKTLAAKKLSSGGLKLGALSDSISFTQARAVPEASAPAKGTSGLNIKRLP